MFIKLLILFTVVPIVEIFLLVKAGQSIGTMYTMAIVIITGAAGASFAKSQGAKVFYDIRKSFNSGQIPGKELLQAALVLVGGVMLLTPGFITDIVGFSLLLPATRQFYAKLTINYFKNKISKGQVQFTATQTDDTGSTTFYTSNREQDIYDGEIIDHPKLEE